MYEPRRAAAVAVVEAEVTPRPATGSGPRRAAPTWRDGLAQRAGVGLVVVAAAATTSAFVIDAAPAPLAATAAIASPEGRDVEVVSRRADRTLQVRTLTTSALAETVGELTSYTPLHTKSRLNIRAEASEKSALLGSVNAGEAVLGTTAIEGKYRKVETDKVTGWVLADHLTDVSPDVVGGITMAPCKRGSAVEKKLRPDTIRIYRSVCPLFPAVNSYGGWRAGGRQFHKNGRALDIMLTPKKESALGWQIANYLIKNAKAFNIDHIIFEQKIWTPRTPHWRKMADRGSITQNHYDHVHVAVRA